MSKESKFKSNKLTGLLGVDDIKSVKLTCRGKESFLTDWYLRSRKSKITISDEKNPIKIKG